MTEAESALFTMLVRERSLRHPTARNFDPNDWLKAAKAIETPSGRDIRLLFAALHYGNEIAVLRATFESQLFADMDRRSATLLSIAMANYNYNVLSGKAQRTRSKSGK